MQINWNLLQPVDIGGSILAGYQMGEGIVRRHQLRGALSAYSQDPTNPEAQNALAMASPEFAMRLGSQRAQAASAAAERERIGRIASNPDRGAAKQEALAGGDFDLYKAIDALGDDEKKQAYEEYKSIAPFAYEAKKLPPEQRQAYVQSLAPQLSTMGWDAEELAGLDLSDAGLSRFITMGSTLEQAMGRDEIKWVVPADRDAFAVDSMGRVVQVGSGKPQSGGAPQGSVASTLSAAGLPAPVVAGFLGNFEVEGGYGGAKGDGGSAHGIAQWRGERQANFQRVIGKPVGEASHEEQAKFVLWEMNNPEAAGMTTEQRDAILAAKTPGEAAELIDQYYERSSGQHRARRVEAANKAAGGDESTIRAQAQEAIAAGADPVAVKARAESMGVKL